MEYQAYVSLRRFVERHVAAIAFVHICTTAAIMESGQDRLEPLTLSWFWAPIISFLLAPAQTAYEWPEWTRRHAIWLFLGGWVVNVLVIPLLFWKHLYQFDGVIHAFRDSLGRALGLGGQTGLVLVTCFLAGCLALVHERIMNRWEARQRRRRY